MDPNQPRMRHTHTHTHTPAQKKKRIIRNNNKLKLNSRGVLTLFPTGGPFIQNKGNFNYLHL